MASNQLQLLQARVEDALCEPNRPGIVNHDGAFAEYLALPVEICISFRTASRMSKPSLSNHLRRLAKSSIRSM